LFPPFVGDVARQLVVAFRACEMRSGGEDPVLPAFFVGSGNGLELLLNRDLDSMGRQSLSEGNAELYQPEIASKMGRGVTSVTIRPD
jgi:hypothetical protein